jgi:hypothetical protein
MKITESKLRHIIRKLILENSNEMKPDKPLDESLKPTSNAVNGIRNMSFALGSNEENCLTINKLFSSLDQDEKSEYGNMMYSLVEYINNTNQLKIPRKIQIGDILFVEEDSDCEPTEDGLYSPLVRSGEMSHTVYDYIRSSSNKLSPIGMIGEVEVPLLFGNYNDTIEFLVDEVEILPFDPRERYTKIFPKNESVKILERTADAERRALLSKKYGLNIGGGGLPPIKPPSKSGGGGGGGRDEHVYKVFFTKSMGFGIVFVVPINIIS